ncbi:hypothetical protein AURDEDRAFT_164403 [Auricularia subglabra TFB-10046 SS5]|nr:hypothetical protein AURDEDRAFT_164403 [Auricularia subglabra TFB-10046 SS5]
MSLTFDGTALYVFIARYTASAAGLSFYLDGVSAGEHLVGPDINGEQYAPEAYNQLVFKTDQLPLKNHTLEMQVQDLSMIWFDYAIYTYVYILVMHGDLDENRQNR